MRDFALCLALQKRHDELCDPLTACWSSARFTRDVELGRLMSNIHGWLVYYFVGVAPLERLHVYAQSYLFNLRGGGNHSERPQQCRAVRVQRSHFTCMTCSATNPTVKLSYLHVCNRRKLRVITEKENRPSLLCFVLSRNSKFVNKLVKVFKVLHLVSSLCNSKGCFFTEITLQTNDTFFMYAFNVWTF